MDKLGNQKCRETLHRSICSPPAMLMITGPQGTGKLESVLEQFSCVAPQDFLRVDGDVDGARQACSFLRSHPICGDVRVVCVDATEGLTDAAQDAYLKAVEEHPPYAVVIFVADDDLLVHPALSSRLDFCVWAPFSRQESEEFAESVGICDEFVVQNARGRKNFILAINKKIGVMKELHEHAEKVCVGSPDLTHVPSIFSGWDKMEDDEKRAALFVCENVARLHANAAILRFVDTMTSVPSANVELHWWRACLACCNVQV